ncbi:hypothetical protein BB561_006229 [Smittium simulii]|uniref:Uncharacterized protein n=1 Tax=Smittium simulii TaxID=133385 RepID=A0A2T9Y5T8_9FUNG|nr:hypothetical protein BB561_006229 [Smittium simulii]
MSQKYNVNIQLDSDQTQDPNKNHNNQNMESEKIIRIFDSRFHYGRLQYLVHFNHTAIQNRSWKDAKQIKNLKIAKRFHSEYPNKPCPNTSIPVRKRKTK